MKIRLLSCVLLFLLSVASYAAPEGALVQYEITDYDMGEGLIHGEKIVHAYNADSSAAADTTFDWSGDTAWAANTIKEYEYDTEGRNTLIRYKYSMGGIFLTVSTIEMEYDDVHALPFRTTSAQSLFSTNKWRQTVTFDSLGCIAEQVFEDSNSAHSWRNTRRYLYEQYEGTTYLAAENTYTWDTAGGAWKADTWVYHWVNTIHKDSVVLHSFWDTSDGGWWNNQARDSMTYTAAGEVAESFLFSWRMDSLRWEPVEKQTYGYLLDTLPYSNCLFNWTGSEWMENMRIVRSRDRNWNLDSVREMGLNGLEWVVTQRTVYFYDDGGTAVASTLPASRAPLLLSAVPNPSSGPAVIRFALPAAGRAELGLYDASGRLVRTLADNAVLPAGAHAMVCGGHLPAGAYVVRLKAGGRVVTAPFVKIR